jgi:hypothetical protein
MIDTSISSKNPFLARVETLQRKVSTDRANPAAAPSGARARLNFLPDESSLLSMIDRALQALSQGRFWDRGSIVNLLV